MVRSSSMRHSRRRVRRLAVVPAAVAATVASMADLAAVRAADVRWDPQQTASTTGVSGGTGTWDNSHAYWALMPSGTSDAVWTDGVSANFNNTGGTVTLGSNISAYAINFNVSNYTIVSSTTNLLTLTSTSTSTFSGVRTDANVSVTLSGAFNINTGASSNAQIWYANTGSVINLAGTLTQTGTSGMIVAGPGIVNYTGSAFTPTKFTLNNGGTFNSSGSATLTTGGSGNYTGIGDGTSGTLNVTAGTFSTSNSLFLGNTLTANPTTQDVGTINALGGVINASASVLIGAGYNDTKGYNGVGVLNVAGGTFNTGTGANTLKIGTAGSGNGTINLNSGTLSTNDAIGIGATTVVTAGYTKGSVINFNGGKLQALGTNLSIAPAIQTNVLAGGAVLDTNGNAVTLSNNFSSGVAGDGGLTKVGNGVLTLSGSNSYNGNTNISAGVLLATTTGSLAGYPTTSRVSVAKGAGLVLRVGGTNGFATTDVDAYFGSVPTGALVGIDTTNQSATDATNLTGGAGLLKYGLNTLTLSGTSSYTGGTQITAGAVNATTSNALGTGPISIGGSSNSSTAGVLQLSGGITLTNTINGVAARTDPVTTNALPHIQNLSGNNTVTSNITDSQVNGTGPIFQSDAGTLTFTGNIDNTSASPYSRSYFFNGAGNFVTNGNFLAGVGNSASNTTNGLLIVKEGTGTLTVNGTGSTFFGGTQIYGGTVRANATSALGSGLTTVNNSGGILAGNGSTGGPVLVLGGGVITAGDGLTGNPSMLTTGTETWNSSGGYTAKFASTAGVAGTSNDLLVMDGLSINASSGSPFFVTAVGTGVALTSGQSLLIATDSNTSSSSNPFTNTVNSALMLSPNSTVTTSDGSSLSLTTLQDAGGYELYLTAAAAPEPNSLAMLALAGAPLIVGRRRRKPSSVASI